MWSHLESLWAIFRQLKPYKTTLINLERFQAIWSHLEQLQASSSNLELWQQFEGIYTNLVKFEGNFKGFLRSWSLLEPFGAIQSHLEPFGANWRQQKYPKSQRQKAKKWTQKMSKKTRVLLSAHVKRISFSCMQGFCEPHACGKECVIVDNGATKGTRHGHLQLSCVPRQCLYR